MTMARLMSLGRTLAVVVCGLLMTYCFVPDQYEAEIRFTKLGAFGITYHGVLTNAPLFGEIARGKIDEAAAKPKIKSFAEQLKRDSSFKEVHSIGRGRFQVRYEREGIFRDAMQMVTFVSRQAPIFRIRTFEDGRLSVAGSGAGRQYAKHLEEVGMTTRGLFRVVTDAEVIEHNAAFVRKSPTPGYTIYDWRIRNFSDIPPRLVAKMTVDPKTGGPLLPGQGTKSGAKDDEDEINLDALAPEKSLRK